MRLLIMTEEKEEIGSRKPGGEGCESPFPELEEIQREVEKRLRDNRIFLERFLDEEFGEDDEEDEDEEHSEEL
jgi:hypothetical protein